VIVRTRIRRIIRFIGFPINPTIRRIQVQTSFRSQSFALFAGWSWGIFVYDRSTMKACLLIILLLFLATSVKAMAPLVPADSGIAVRVGDTVNYFGFDFNNPPCPANVEFALDQFSFINSDKTNFSYYLQSGQMFYAIFTPQTTGVHYDTVKFHIWYYSARSPRDCMGDWYSSTSYPTVYHAIPDSTADMQPRNLTTFQMKYNDTLHRYESTVQWGFRLKNRLTEATSFTLHVNGSLFSKSFSVIVDSINSNAITLSKNFGQYVAPSLFVSDKMNPVTRDTSIKCTISCRIKNTSLDTTILTDEGILNFREIRLDSGATLKTVMVGDTLAVTDFALYPTPVSTLTDSITVTNSDNTNFHFLIDTLGYVFLQYTPHYIGLIHDTLSFQIIYGPGSNSTGQTAGFGPNLFVCNAIAPPKLEINTLAQDTFHFYYDDTRNTYYCSSQYGLILRNNSSEQASFSFRTFIDPALFSNNILTLVNPSLDSIITLPSKPEKFWTYAIFKSESMLPLVTDSVVPYRLIANIKSLSLDTTILTPSRFVIFHFLDSGMEIPISDTKKVNDTITVPTDIVKFERALRYHDSTHFHFFPDPRSMRILADYTPQKVGIYRDTLYVDGYNIDGYELHSGPIPIVYHAVAGTNRVSIKNELASTAPTISIYDSKVSINFTVSNPSDLTLSILDITGRTIDHICTNKFYQPGSYSMDYIPHMPSGQYFLSFSSKDGTKVVPFSYVR
jgi:hypothetical protein